MSDMYGAVRSNYFEVKDAAKFKAWFNESVKFGDEIELFEEGNVFGFGGYEQYPNAWPMVPANDECGHPREDEWDPQAFAKEVRKHLVKGQEFHVVASGHEKLRYVGASAFIVPVKGKPRYISLYSDHEDILKQVRSAVKP